jgi:hypothetical protein
LRDCLKRDLRGAEHVCIRDAHENCGAGRALDEKTDVDNYDEVSRR